MSQPLSIDVLTATVEPTGVADPAAAARRVGSLQRRMAGAELERAWSTRYRADRPLVPALPGPRDRPRPGPPPITPSAGSGPLLSSGPCRSRRRSRRAPDRPLSSTTATTSRRSPTPWPDSPPAGWTGPGRWTQLGLLPSAPDTDSTQTSRPLVAALGRRPELAVQVIASAVRRCGYAALSRALGDDGWQQVAETVWSAGGHATGPPGFLARPRPADDRNGHDVRAGGSDAHPAGARSAGARSARDRSADDRPAVVWPVGSELAQAVRSSSLIPTARTVDAVSLLIGLELDPNLPRRPGSWAMLESIRGPAPSGLVGRSCGRSTEIDDRRPTSRSRRGRPHRPSSSTPLRARVEPIPPAGTPVERESAHPRLTSPAPARPPSTPRQPSRSPTPTTRASAI